MTWNYRVVRRVYPGADEEFYVHEVYYTASRVAHARSELPSAPCGDTPEELRADLERMLKAFEKPVLEFDDPCWGGPVKP